MEQQLGIRCLPAHTPGLQVSNKVDHQVLAQVQIQCGRHMHLLGDVDGEPEESKNAVNLLPDGLHLHSLVPGCGESIHTDVRDVCLPDDRVEPRPMHPNSLSVQLHTVLRPTAEVRDFLAKMPMHVGRLQPVLLALLLQAEGPPHNSQHSTLRLYPSLS